MSKSIRWNPRMRSPFRAGSARALALACAVGGLAELAWAAPPNDACGQAQTITLPGLNAVTTLTGTTDEATSDVSQGCALGDALDVWFRFVAPATGTYTFDTIDSLMFDTTLAAYSTCGGAQLACNDNIDTENFNFWSLISLNLNVGQAVLVRVAGALGDADGFVMHVSSAGSVTNDACANAFAVTLGQTVVGTTIVATTDFVLPAAACGSLHGSGGARDVFYSFTPATSGPYLVKTCGSLFDTVVAVLSNCSGSAGSVLACNDDSFYCAASMHSTIPTVQLTAGVRYLIRVAGYDFGPPVDVGIFSLIVVNASPGVCCRGTTCTPISAANCFPLAGAGGARYVVNGQTCNPAGERRSPCCYVDYNKDGVVSVQDVFDFLNDWFAMRPTAVFGGDGQPAPMVVQQVFDFLNAFFVGC